MRTIKLRNGDSPASYKTPVPLLFNLLKGAGVPTADIGYTELYNSFYTATHTYKASFAGTAWEELYFAYADLFTFVWPMYDTTIPMEISTLGYAAGNTAEHWAAVKRLGEVVQRIMMPASSVYKVVANAVHTDLLTPSAVVLHSNYWMLAWVLSEVFEVTEV